MELHVHFAIMYFPSCSECALLLLQGHLASLRLSQVRCSSTQDETNHCR